MERNLSPKRKHPTAGMWLCSYACSEVVEKRSHVVAPCLNCGIDVERRKSQMKESVFCSRECTDAYGLEEVKCCWPGCDEVMNCRTFQHVHKGRAATVYKTDLRKNGKYVEHVMCEHHIALAKKYSGSDGRITNGRIKLLSDPDAVYDVRAASSKFLRAVVFDRAKCACEECHTDLMFDAPMGTWNVDHIVPYYLGGETRLSNLLVLCANCHNSKSSGEKSHAAKERHVMTKANRWETHLQKDQLIAKLRLRLEELGASIE